MLSRVFGFGRRSFDSLSEQEVLALAISSEEDDARIYRAYADGLADAYPNSAKVFEQMAAEEDGHRASLIELRQARFGERIPLDDQDMAGEVGGHLAWHPQSHAGLQPRRIEQPDEQERQHDEEEEDS